MCFRNSRMPRLLAILLSCLACWALPVAAVELSPEEQAWLAEHPQLRLGIDASWPPFEFRDEQGRYSVSVHSKTSCHPADFRPRVTSYSTTRGYFHEKTPHRRTVASPNRSAA